MRYRACPTGRSPKAQLKDSRAIEHYLATYRAERKRLAVEGAGKRAGLDVVGPLHSVDRDRYLHVLDLPQSDPAEPKAWASPLMT